MERVESAQTKAFNKVVSVRLSKALDVKAQLKLNPLDSTGQMTVTTSYSDIKGLQMIQPILKSLKPKRCRSYSGADSIR